MPYTRTFENRKPPARYDGTPYTEAIVLESPTESGSYTSIDTIALSPVDADPTTPATRNFTTDSATLSVGWYVIRWQDAGGAQFNSDPIEYFADAPYSGDYADVKTKLARMTDADTEPTLNDADLEDVLTAAARPDTAGLTWDDDDWTETWDLDAGAVEGWARKASKAAAWFSFAEDGQRFERAQTYAHCVSQREMYARRAIGTLQADSTVSSG